MAKRRKKSKYIHYARAEMCRFLKSKTGRVSWYGQAPSNTELFTRCEDQLKLSPFMSLTKMQRVERIVKALGGKGWDEFTGYVSSKGARQPKRKEAKSFYDSDRWRDLRYRVLLASDGCCECCGRAKKDGVILHVDHIKPRSRYPELQWNISNLQVLYEDCNLGKRAWDETDWREPSLRALMGEEMN